MTLVASSHSGPNGNDKKYPTMVSPDARANEIYFNETDTTALTLNEIDETVIDNLGYGYEELQLITQKTLQHIPPPQYGDMITLMIKGYRKPVSLIFDGTTVVHLLRKNFEDCVPKQFKILDERTGVLPAKYWSYDIESLIVWFDSDRIIFQESDIMTCFPEDVIPVPPLRSIITGYATTTYKEKLIDNIRFRSSPKKRTVAYSSVRIYNQILTIVTKPDYNIPDEEHKQLFISGLEEGMFHHEDRSTRGVLYLPVHRTFQVTVDLASEATPWQP